MTLNLDDPEVRANAVHFVAGFAKYTQMTHGWTDEQRIDATKEFLRFEEEHPEEKFKSNLCEAFDCEDGDIKRYYDYIAANRRVSISDDFRRITPPELKRFVSDRESVSSKPQSSYGVLTKKTILPKTMQMFLKNNLSGNDLGDAKAIGISKVTLIKLKNGANTYVTPKSIIKICDYFGTSPDKINSSCSANINKDASPQTRKGRAIAAVKAMDYRSYSIDIIGFGAYIKELREEIGMSSEEMAGKIDGFEAAAIKAHEEGKVNKVYLPFLKAFCVGMDVRPEAIEEFCLRHAQAPTFVVNRRSSP